MLLRNDKQLENDHIEAIILDQQIMAAPPGTTPQHIFDLNRFCECCEDSEGYDVPKERMRALKAAGLVDGGCFGWYTATDLGMTLRLMRFEQANATGSTATAT